MQITIINPAAWATLRDVLPQAVTRVMHPSKGVRIVPLGRGFGSGNADGGGMAGNGGGCSDGGGNGNGHGYGAGVIPDGKKSVIEGL